MIVDVLRPQGCFNTIVARFNHDCLAFLKEQDTAKKNEALAPPANKNLYVLRCRYNRTRVPSECPKTPNRTFAQKQEMTRKDVDRAFGVLQSLWAIEKG